MASADPACVGAFGVLHHQASGGLVSWGSFTLSLSRTPGGNYPARRECGFNKNMPTLPSDFTTNVSSNSSAMIANLSPYAELVIGVLLAAVVLTVIIRAISGHH